MSENIEHDSKRKTALKQQLRDAANRHNSLHLNELFTQKNRFEKFSVQFDQIVFDYSKHRMDQQVLDGLLAFAQSNELASWIQRFFSEEKINSTEQRAAMHWALRQPMDHKKFPQINQQVHQQLERMYALVEKLHAGQYRGATGA